MCTFVFRRFRCTSDIQMKVDKLAAILTAKEKELEATEMSSRGMFKVRDTGLAARDRTWLVLEIRMFF